MTDWPGLAFAFAILVLAAIILVRPGSARARGSLASVLLLFSIAGLSRERISELVVSYKEVRVEMTRLRTRVDEIANALETLVIAQPILRLEPDNSILLDYEPVPQSVRVIEGPLVLFPRPSYGLQLDGRYIRILDPKMLERLKSRIPEALTVEYLRRIRRE
jgi:hypothetical protein